ncbi:MAG TPA: MerR family transcriptional regulator [Vicinamibacterales bacterium]|jgi:DNA-binding transcriptional MerR regulator
MERRYRVRDFAQIVGVTVKALQHYDRIGVLKPSRTPAGHRIYSDRDVERVRHIVALKSIGVPLKRIKAVLDGHRVSLTDALKSQREELVAQRNGLQHVLNAIALVEEELARGGSDAQALTQLVDLLIIQSDVDAMRKYFSPEAWAKFGDYWVDWPPPQWRELFRDAEAALDESPEGEKAEALVARFYALWHAEAGDDPDVKHQIRTGTARAFLDRDNWPPRLQRRWMEFRFPEITRFLGKATMAAYKRHGLQFFAPTKRAD